MHAKRFPTAVAALAAVGSLSLASGAAPASASRCAAVRAGSGVADQIRTRNLTCARARRVLRVWVRRGAFPVASYGQWYCEINQGGTSLCSGGNGGRAPYMTFRYRG